MKRPETEYAETIDGLFVAYQVSGGGPVDILFTGAMVSHVELDWELPGAARMFERLSSMGRLIRFDKRNTGLSDRVRRPEEVALDQRLDDARAVLDAVGSRAAVLVAMSEGSPVAAPFAATQPERTIGLVLHNATACLRRKPDYPIGLPDHIVERAIDMVTEDWEVAGGMERAFRVLAPSLVEDPEHLARAVWLTRHVGGRRAVDEQARLYDVDIREVLPSALAPTLVTHCRDNEFIRATHGRYLADRIPGARFVGLPGADHLYYAGAVDELADEIEEFVTGARPTTTSDRVLATVAFTDIVGSTAGAAAVGDRAWRQLIDRHDEMVSSASGCTPASASSGATM